MTHICVSKLTIIGSDNGLSPDRRQAIIWTNAGILLIGPLGTNFSEILIEIQTFSFTKMRMKVSSAKRRPLCLSLNVWIWLWGVLDHTCLDKGLYLFGAISKPCPQRFIWNKVQQNAMDSNLLYSNILQIPPPPLAIWYVKSLPH